MARALMIRNETDTIDFHIALVLSGGALAVIVAVMVIFRTIM